MWAASWYRPYRQGTFRPSVPLPYTSPFDQEQYGSLSLTFYPTTSRLLVQGTSYLLWVEEHLPAIYGEAETRYLADISSWRSLALRGIGIKRDSRHRRDRRQISNTHVTDTVLPCTFDCRDSASAATPVADSAGTITASPADSYRHDAPSLLSLIATCDLMTPSSCWFLPDFNLLHPTRWWLHPGWHPSYPTGW